MSNSPIQWVGMLTWPTERCSGAVLIRFTIADAGSVRGDKSQLECQGELIIESRDVSCEAHSHTAKDGAALTVAHLGEGDDTASLRVLDLL